MRFSRARASLWALWLVVCGLCLYCTFLTWAFSKREKTLSNQLRLARVLVPGRTRTDVIQWLGQPSYEREGDRIAGEDVHTVMAYRSSRRRIHGPEDIWIVLDGRDRIVAVYYPELPQEKAIMGFPAPEPPSGASPGGRR